MKCLVHYQADLTAQCEVETSRAARMALWDYKVRATRSILYRLTPPALNYSHILSTPSLLNFT